MKINGCTVEVFYSATKGCPEKKYERNGDYGCPEEHNEIEISMIIYQGVDVIELLGDQVEELDIALDKIEFGE